MKVLLLADHSSPHTIKWANAISKEGIHVFIISLNPSSNGPYQYNSDIQIMCLGLFGNQSKLSYIKALPKVCKTIRKWKPDILHAHYASSYGLIGAMTFFKPFIISVWGSDVFEFPTLSLLNRIILKFNFFRAGIICSTSVIMKKEIEKFVNNKEIHVIPFGIDLSKFKKNSLVSLKKTKITIGTIKTLEKIYGIEYLIKAFKIVKDRNPTVDLELLIVGKGSLEKNLKQLCSDLNILENVIFTGPVPYQEISTYHNLIDIFVAISLQESFGVAVLEASGCEVPVITSNVGGLPEVVIDGNTGFLVVPENEIEAANAIEKLVKDESLRIFLGKNGRKFVSEKYDFNKNICQLLNVYKRCLE